MGRFRVQLLIQDGYYKTDTTLSTQYTIAENTQNSDNPTDWTLLMLDFTIENYSVEMNYDEIDGLHGGMCFSNITTTHSVY